MRPLLLAILLALPAWSYDWTAINMDDTVFLAETGTSEYQPAPFGTIAYDSIYHCTYLYESYTEGNPSNWNTSIYANSAWRYCYDGVNDTLHQLTRSNFNNLTPGSGYNVIPLAANDADPTIPDRHPTFAFNPVDTSLVFIGGLNSYLYDTLSFAPADVNTTTGSITNINAAAFARTDAVHIHNSGGALPTGWSAATAYNLIKISNTEIRLATSRSNAYNGTAVVPSDQGSGTHRVTRDGDGPQDIWTININRTGSNYLNQTVRTPSVYFTQSGLVRPTSVVYSRSRGAIIAHALAGYATACCGQRTWLLPNNYGDMTDYTSGGSTTDGSAPNIQSHNSIAISKYDGTAWIFAAQPDSAFDFSNRLWKFPEATNVWDSVVTASRPSKRWGPGVRWLRDTTGTGDGYLLIYGGRRPGPTYLTDTWLYDIDANTWTQLSTVTSPTAGEHNYLEYDYYRGRAILRAANGTFWTMRIGCADSAWGGTGSCQAAAASGHKKMTLLGVGGGQ